MKNDLLETLSTSLGVEELVALATVVESSAAAVNGGVSVGRQLLIWPSGEVRGDLGSPRLNQRASLFAEQVFTSQKSRRKVFDTDDGEVDLFVEVFAPPPKLIIIGAVHAAIPLVSYAKSHGFRTVVIDPRTAFATAERFAAADELLGEWPHDVLPDMELNEGTYMAFLSHDPKIDQPALAIALRSRARYLGVLGSKKTHAKRVAGLLELGFSQGDCARLHNPIGLDLGGRKAEEIALSVMAEVVAVRNGIGVRPHGTLVSR